MQTERPGKMLNYAFLSQKINFIFVASDSRCLGTTQHYEGHLAWHYQKHSWKYFLPLNTFHLVQHLGCRILGRKCPCSRWLNSSGIPVVTSMALGLNFPSIKRAIYEFCCPKVRLFMFSAEAAHCGLNSWRSDPLIWDTGWHYTIASLILFSSTR